jgi:DNA-binding HxlR family transcriptional regulator
MKTCDLQIASWCEHSERGGVRNRQDGVISAEPSPLQEAVALVGDRWSLLLVNALLEGPRRFNDLLDAVPGLAPNILSRRLKHLEHEGLVVATPYSERPPRFEYRLSASGAELAGALRLLAQWGAQRAAPARAGEEAPLRHARCGTPVEARWYCPTCHEVVEPDDAADLDYA